MTWPTITKHPDPELPVPNLADYERTRREFSWGHARGLLDGLPEGAGLNIAHEAVDRHALGHLRGKVALRCLRRNGRITELTYGELAAQTARFANVLRALGVRPTERVFSLLGRVPELYVAALGTLKHRSVFCPLFSAFGPEPIETRLRLGDARVLVTTEPLYRRKVQQLRARLPQLEHVIIVGESSPADTHRFEDLMAAAAPELVISPTDPQEMALLHFTSGTTGTPKGAVHVHEAVVAHHITGKLALDLHPDDIYWCTADPGWVTGTSYGIIAPLTCGVTSIVDEAEFDAERWYRTLAEQRVTVWYTAPTAIRMLMKLSAPAHLRGRWGRSPQVSGAERSVEGGLSHGVRSRHDLAVRFAASVGEPLNPEAVVWGNEQLGVPFHDNWWQTETGGIMIANFAALPIEPGSMGRPLPGIEAAIVRRTSDGGVEVITDPESEGELALRPGWPSMFRGYLHEEERYRKCFAGGWYLTGDLARRDRNGLFWFVGRADDVIKSAGHLIGPFEVESALMEHPAVAEAAAIGKPDPVAGEIVKAFVCLKPGVHESPKLMRELTGFARKRLGPAVAPRELAVIADLPRTRSGKIMRRLLKARELGLPEGDTSTLEAAP